MATKSEKNATKSAASRPAPPRNKKIEAPDVEDVKNLIRSALRAQQTYSESLEFAISVCAGNYVAYSKCLASMGKRAKVQYTVLTREGSKAYKTYPDIELMPQLSRALKESLKSLGLTLDTLEAADNDPLDTLTNSVNGLLNG